MTYIYIYLVLSAAYSTVYIVHCAKAKRSVWGPSVFALLPLGAFIMLLIID